MAANPNINQPSNALQNTPYGVDQTVPLGSPVIADSASTVVQSNLLQRDFGPLFRTGPKTWDEAAMVVLGKTPITRNSRIMEWWTRGWQFAPAVAGANSASAAAVVGGFATQSVTFSTATATNLGLDTEITYPDNSVGTITAIDYSTGVATVRARRGAALPAVTSGDEFAIGLGTVMVDGRDYIPNVQRPTYGQDFNYLTRIEEACRWDRHEMVEWKNNQNLQYVEDSIRDVNERIRFKAMANFWNGTRGEIISTGGGVGTRMGGIYPFCVSAGALNQTIDVSVLQASLEAAILNTNFGARGGRRALFAREGVLLQVSKLYKGDITRVTWDNEIANLNISAIKIGGQLVYLVPTEYFSGATGLLNSGVFHNMLACVNMDNIDLAAQKGMPFYMNGTSTKSLMDGDGSLKDYTIYRAEMNFSAMYPNPLEHFFFTLTGLAS